MENRSKIIDIIEQLPGVDATELKNLSDNESLISTGIVDSLSFALMISEIESQFNISIAEDELKEINFESISKIDAFIKEKKEDI